MKMESQIKFARATCCWIIVLLLLGGFSRPDARAIGFLIPNQDASAIARGNAFAATADNPSAIYYNPAGITQIPGKELQIGDLNYLGLNVHHDSAAGFFTDTKYEVIPVPQIFATWSPTNLPLSFGLGVYAPFGLGVKWPGDSGLRSLALDSKLTFLTVNPVVAWKVLPSLSLAVGPTINYGKIKFTRGLASPGDYFRFVGDDFAFGLTAGVLWQPHPMWSFGGSYRLATTMDFGGNSTYTAAAGMPTAYTRTKASVPFPQIVSGGISFRPTPKWNLEADLDYINWDTLNTVTLAGTKNIFGFDLPLKLDWHDSWQYKFGVTRYFDGGWFVSAGYFFTSDTTSAANFTPAVPDTGLHVGSLGFGRNSERWSWALAGQIIAGPARTIAAAPGNTNPYTGVSAAGKYQLFIPTVTFSVSRKF
jgi:long-chain fatty acid transport protein